MINEGFIIWLVVGGLIGWVASLLLSDGGNGILINIVVGIVGSFLGGYFLSPYFHTKTINQYDFSFPSLAVSLLGAVILLAVVNLFRRSRLRR